MHYFYSFIFVFYFQWIHIQRQLKKKEDDTIWTKLGKSIISLFSGINSKKLEREHICLIQGGGAIFFNCFNKNTQGHLLVEKS